MIVVADTSPLNYLVLIGQEKLLPVLFGEIAIPNAVALELLHPRASFAVRSWMSAPPLWLTLYTSVPNSHPELSGLDPGEREAIELAVSIGAELLLIDEVQGRQQAINLNLKIRGTLGVLEQASRLGILDLNAASQKLMATNFRLSPAVLQQLLPNSTS